ncbi:MAG TPA: hypothetical protein ENG92_05985 [Thiolapillus brandeum]|uniref:Uncharacterized protein n=1 Tax=Thiolapillus brandeum TaxID=1076588 RepID=A0A831KCW2_9GAMM|nr:hypothetical protein [Thiolapillus brandeum]
MIFALSQQEQTALKKLHESILKEGYIPEIFAKFAKHGLPVFRAYEAYKVTRKSLYNNYPNQDFVKNLALKNGISELNAVRFGQLYTEHDATKQHTLLMDIMTSEGKEYLEAVIGATITALTAMNLDTISIVRLFQEETDGRVAIKLEEAIIRVGAELVVRATRPDQFGNVVVTVSSKEGGKEEGDSEGGGDVEGGGTGGAGGSGGSGGSGGGKLPGGRTPWQFFRDLVWNTVGGAATGAGLGTMVGPTGTAPGAALGGLAGATYTVLGGFKAELDGPCSSPLVLC